MQHVLTVRNDLADLALLGAWAEGLLSPAERRGRDRFRVDIALTEAVTNVINNAFPDGGSHEITLVADQTPTRLSIVVVDGGRPFNPLEVPEPVRPARLEDAKPGGLGIVLIRKYCDRLSYERAGGRNRLTLDFDMAHATGSPR